MKDSILKDKSKSFAMQIVYLYKYLCDEKREFIMSKQLLKSGTSIGANIMEAQFAQSLPDFASKMSIALKEASETLYWLELLTETEYLDKQQSEELVQSCYELIKMLHSTVKTSKQKL